MHSKMDVPRKSKRLIIWNGGSSKVVCFDVSRHHIKPARLQQGRKLCPATWL